MPPAPHITPTTSLTYLPPSELAPDPRNPRTHDKRHVKQLARSIEAFGFNAPILIDNDNRVIAGHGRLAAALLLELPMVSTVRLSHLSEPQRRAYMVADNRLNELSSWNEPVLAEILMELADADLDFDFTAAGYSVTEVDLKIDGLDGDRPDAADVLPEAGPAICALGDRYDLGNHRVICASALETASYVDLMQGDQADLVASDPPYNVPIQGHVSGLGKARHREFPQASG